MGKSRRRWSVAIVFTVLTVALGVAPAAAEKAEDSTTQACTLQPTGGTVQRTIGSRSYLLRVPDSISGPDARLVLSLHGWTGTAQGQETSSGLSDLADQEGFIVAYPTGTYMTLIPFPAVGWDYFGQSSQDLDFLRSVVADISSTYCVNPNRVHAEGISMGGLMAQRFACEAPDVVASVVGHATNDVTRAWFDIQPSEPCSLSESTSVMLSCGATDAATDNGCAPARDAWASRLACPAPTKSMDSFGSVWDYGSCSGGSELVWRLWDGLGHAYPPAGAAKNQFHDELNEFFIQHPRT